MILNQQGEYGKKETVGNMFVKKLKPIVKIQGDGSSLWGSSDKSYSISRIEVNCYDFAEDHGEVEFFGRNTKWFQYTDNLIEKEVTEKLKPIIEEVVGRKVKKLGWSEQGMQPDDGWSFDVTFYKRKKK